MPDPGAASLPQSLTWGSAHAPATQLLGTLFLKGSRGAEWGAHAPYFVLSLHCPDYLCKEESNLELREEAIGLPPGLAGVTQVIIHPLTAGSPGRCREHTGSPPGPAAPREPLEAASTRPGRPLAPGPAPCFPRPGPRRRPHHHHQGLAVYRWEPPAASPATKLQGGRHLAGADLCYPGSTFVALFPARGIEGRG